MSNTIIIKNREPQAISIRGGGEVLGITTVYVNGIDVTEGSVAYVIVPTKTSELTNDSGFINHEVDPTVPYYVKQITQADINSWNNKQDELVSGTNIKTINSNSLLGSGNIDISTSYTAGTGININSENVISNTITSYNDLSDLPNIPTSTSELLNDSGYLVADDLANVAFSGSYADLSDVPDLSEYATLDTEDLENYYTKRFMWNILPRTTGSGVSVSLSDTLNEAPIELSLAPSELSQEATPTPDSPQVVHTISGDNTIKVNNLQEADINLKSKNLFKISGYSKTGWNITIDNPLKGMTAGKYSISAVNNYITSGKGIAIYNANTVNAGINDRIGTLLTNYDFGSTTLTSENRNLTQEQLDCNYMIIAPTDSACTEEVLNNMQIMIEIGETATSYVPYFNYEYCKIGNYADEFIKTSGKNLFDKDNIGTTGSWLQSTGETTVSSTWSITDFIPIEPNKIYVTSGMASGTGTNPSRCYYDINKSYISGTIHNSANPFIDTSPNNAYYMKESIKNEDINTIMISEGTTAIDYEPYGSNEWYIKKNIGKVVFTGANTEGWRMPSTDTNNAVFCNYLNTSIYDFRDMNDTQYSNYFNWKGVGYGYQDALNGGVGMYTNIQNVIYKYVYYVIPLTEASTVEQWYQWLSSHNLEMYYVLATPTYTQITGTLAEQLENAYYNLTAYDNQTNISQTNNDLPFVISASTPKTLVNM